MTINFLRLISNTLFCRPITQECLDKHLLEFAGEYDGLTRVPEGEENRMFQYKLKLPQGVTCEHCVIQWFWKTGKIPMQQSTFVGLCEAEILK